MGLPVIQNHFHINGDNKDLGILSTRLKGKQCFNNFTHDIENSILYFTSFVFDFGFLDMGEVIQVSKEYPSFPIHHLIEDDEHFLSGNYSIILGGRIVTVEKGLALKCYSEDAVKMKLEDLK